MRFLVDECIGPTVARWLRESGHDVASVFDEFKGAEDEWIIEKAYSESRIIKVNIAELRKLLGQQ